MAIQSGEEYVIDIDLTKFFDRVNHDRLIHLLSGHVDDKRILRFIGMILRSSVMKDGSVLFTEEGIPQGSPLPPSKGAGLTPSIIGFFFKDSPGVKFSL